jgi:hypothetical protein
MMSPRQDEEWNPCPPGTLARAIGVHPAQTRERSLRPFWKLSLCMLMIVGVLCGWWIVRSLALKSVHLRTPQSVANAAGNHEKS